MIPINFRKHVNKQEKQNEQKGGEGNRREPEERKIQSGKGEKKT